MISNVQFWHNWPKPLKVALFIFSALAVFLLVALSFWYFKGLENTIQWDLATELNKKFIATEAFVEKGLRFTDNELVYYLKEWYIPSIGIVNVTAAMILLVATLLSISLISTALSFQNSFWFFGSLIIIASFLILSRTEIVFQSTNNYPFILAFSLLGGLLFLFNSFFKRAGFWLRFITIFAAFVILVLIALKFSKVNFPLLALSQYGLLFPIICFAVFVFIIGHEILAGLIWTVSSAAEKGKSSFITYLGIAIIYLLNCFLIYLENIRAIDDSFMVISPVFLYAVSLILGFWGFKKQTEDRDIFSFERTGAWLYLGLAIGSTAFIGFAYATGNDPLIELINDYLAIAHLSLGLAFFGHVTLNFIGLFQKGLNVHLVLYKPNFSSLLLAKIAAVFIVLFFLIQKNIYSYNQLRSGLNNAIADYYLAEGDLTAAESYYKESVNFDFYNHKANYALAGMAKNVGDGVTAAYYFKQANIKNASEFAYVGLSQHLENEDLYFDALFTLREANSKFPESKYLATNIARLLEKAHVRDSVYFYLDKASKNCSSCDVEKVNLQAFWIENALPAKLDSVSTGLEDENYQANLANQLAISRMTAKVRHQLKKLPKNSSLNTADFAAIYNQITLPENTLQQADSSWDELINNEANIVLNEDLRYLKASQSFQYENKISGIKQLAYLAQDSTETGLLYRRKLGLWYLKEGLFDRAVGQFYAAGDAASAQVLIDNNFQSHLLQKQLQEAGEYLQMEINEESYKALYQKAPFNPYLLNDIADFLVVKGREGEAYQKVFDALEFNESSISLWQKYVDLALLNGVPDYAENGVNKLKKLMKPEDFNTFLDAYIKKKFAQKDDF
jgi:hypothetical protein